MNQNSDLLKRLKSIECPDSTFHSEKDPLVFAKAKGSRVWDADGKEYIDFCAGFGVMALGHNHPRIRKIHQDPNLVMHSMGDVYGSVAKVEFLENLTRSLPGHLNRGALSVTGSQAVEYALKTAFLKTKRSGIIAIEGAYHGLDFGALAVSSRQDFREPFEKWLQAGKVEFVSPTASEKELKNARDQLERSGHGLAAIIAEPIQGRAGVRPLGFSFLNQLKNFAHENDSLLIFDEIFCGFGRTGRMTFGEEVHCDITCLGKPMGGGLPLSGFFTSDEIMSAWPESKGEAIHTGTFFGHSLACRYGVEVLKVLSEDGVLDEVHKISQLIKKEIKRHSSLSHLTLSGEGLMLSLKSESPGYGALLMNAARGEGLIVLASGEKGEGISLTPAFNIDETDIIQGIQALAKAAFVI